MQTLRGMVRREETTLRLGGQGDNWHMSWADDDRQYTSLCDGKAWPDVDGYTGREYNTRVFAIEGDPHDTRFVHLPGFPDLHIEAHPNINRYYGFGILALDGHIYNYLSTPNYPFEMDDARFVGAKLIHSPDNGATWQNQGGGPVQWEPWEDRHRDNMIFFEEEGDTFALITVLQMGKNYEHNRDGFVYLYAPNGSVEGTMNQLGLARVPKDRILQRTAYEFFAGRNADGTGQWSADIGLREPVHVFPSGWINVEYHPYAWHPSVVYNAPLDLYMMLNWGMGCEPDGVMWFGKPSYLGLWIAQRPEGPWTQVHEETAWTPAGDAAAHAYQPQIAPKWMAADGRSFWLVWTDFQLIGETRPYYSFNLQKVDLNL